METQKHPAFPPGVEWLIEAILKIANGGSLEIGANGKLKVNGVDVTNVVAGLAGGYKLARGQHTTVAASDTVVTGLTSVAMAVAVLDSDPSDDPFLVSCSIGDQAGAPAAGSILIKTWKNTGGTDPTPAAATTFTKKVNWIALGT